METINNELDEDDGNADVRRLEKRTALEDRRSSEDEFSECQNVPQHSKVIGQKPDLMNLPTTNNKPSIPSLLTSGLDLAEVTHTHVELHLDKTPNTGLTEIKEENLRLRQENEMLKNTIARLEKESAQKTDDNAKRTNYGLPTGKNEGLQELLNTEVKDHQDLRKQLKQQTMHKCTVSTQTSLADLCQNVGNITDMYSLFNVPAKDSMQLMDDQGQVHLTLQEPKGAQDETGEFQTAMPPGEVQTIWVVATIANDGVNNNVMNENSDDPMLTASYTFPDNPSGNEVFIDYIVSTADALPEPIFAKLTQSTPQSADDSDPYVLISDVQNTPAGIQMDDTVNGPLQMNHLLGEQLQAGTDHDSDTAVAIGTVASNSSIVKEAQVLQDTNNSNESSPSTSGTKRPAQHEPPPSNNKKRKSSNKLKRQRPEKNWTWTSAKRVDLVLAILKVRQALTVTKKGEKPKLPTETRVLDGVAEEDMKTQKFPSANKMKSEINNIVKKYRKYVNGKCKEYAKKCEEHQGCYMQKYQEYQQERSLEVKDVKANDASLYKIIELLRAGKL